MNVSMRQSARIIFILGILIIPYHLSAQMKTDSWPLFHGDQGLSGNTPVIIPKTPKLAWTYKAAEGINSSPVIGNNCIYIGSDGGTLYCLSLAGKLIWKFNAGNAIEAPPMYYNNSVYIGSLEGDLFALDAKTGKQRWKYKTEGQISGSPNYFLAGSAKRMMQQGNPNGNTHLITILTVRQLFQGK
jgi:outer membrane protein assembly factor BamB